MIAYQTDYDGVFVGPVECDESPLEPGVFLVPAGAVTEAPPQYSDKQFAQWDGSDWVIQTVPEPEPEPEPAPVPDITREDVEGERRLAYQSDSDPLFFGWQRGENTEQDWLDAVQAVKDANPYPEGS
jgi:hypothetical protein